MRQTKMGEWMENVEKAISRIMADKVYTSAEFKRERDNFHVSLYFQVKNLQYHELRISLLLTLTRLLYVSFSNHLIHNLSWE